MQSGRLLEMDIFLALLFLNECHWLNGKKKWQGIWWLLEKLSYDLLYSKPPALRVDLQRVRWAWKTSACPGMGKGEMEEMQEWCVLLCAGPARIRSYCSSCSFSPALLMKFCMFWSSRKSVHDLFLLPSEPETSPFISLNASSVNIHLILWNGLPRCASRQLFYCFDCIKKLHLKYPKNTANISHPLLSQPLLNSVGKIKLAYSTMEREKKIFWPYGVISIQEA